MTNLKKVNLALQGGGSHGAFTWGVLDYLLEDGRLDIAAVSGTSAGAMNAVVLAQGWLENGREGARDALQRFWRAISTGKSTLAGTGQVLRSVFLGRRRSAASSHRSGATSSPISPAPTSSIRSM